MVYIAVFLFIVNSVFGAYIFFTTDRVDHTATQVKVALCAQTAAFHDAYTRETSLIQTARTKSGVRAHRRSARQLKRYLGEIEPLIDCPSRHSALPH